MSERLYPAYPLPGVIAVVRRDARVLLCRRARPPRNGLWGCPGGLQLLGETVAEAALRELREEASVEAINPRVLTVFDVIERDEPDADGVRRVRHHYTLTAILFDWAAGEGEAGDDAAEIGWFDAPSIATLAVVPELEAILRQARAAG
jgi:ADP-ribose pyrophosphatase YjhB (NUDIX family)